MHGKIKNYDTFQFECKNYLLNYIGSLVIKQYTILKYGN